MVGALDDFERCAAVEIAVHLDHGDVAFAGLARDFLDEEVVDAVAMDDEGIGPGAVFRRDDPGEG